jgi:NAD(P)-dependent dehydrogenase (short-subunit alcohol dehydrogenase family)
MQLAPTFTPAAIRMAPPLDHNKNQIQENKMDQLQGKVAAVTGATGSIGRAIAARFAREGAKVAVVDTDAAEGAEVVKQIGAAGGTAKFIKANVAVKGEARRAIDEAAKTFGRLDVLVNSNWLLTPWKCLLDKDEADFEESLNRCVLGTLRAMNAAFPHMKKQSGGRIVNIASPYGATTYANIGDSVTSDWSLQGLTRAASVEWGEHNILVNMLIPGLVDIPEFQNYRATDRTHVDNILRQMPLERLGDPVEDIGGAAMFLVSDEGCFINGHPIYADGGQHLNGATFAPGVKN